MRGGNGLIGWGAAATLTVPAGPSRFAAAERMLRKLFDAAETEDLTSAKQSEEDQASGGKALEFDAA